MLILLLDYKLLTIFICNYKIDNKYSNVSRHITTALPYIPFILTEYFLILMMF